MASKKKVEETQEVVAEETQKVVAEETQEVVAAPEKPKAPKVEIIRGRMPAPVVLAIKSEPAEMTDGALAAKYRTTNGKISDIRKNRNFAYITAETFVANDADCRNTVTWAVKHGDEGMIAWATSLAPGDETARAAYDEARKSSRPGRKKKETATTEEVEAAAEDLSELE